MVETRPRPASRGSAGPRWARLLAAPHRAWEASTGPGPSVEAPSDRPGSGLLASASRESGGWATGSAGPSVAWPLGPWRSPAGPVLTARGVSEAPWCRPFAPALRLSACAASHCLQSRFKEREVRARAPAVSLAVRPRSASGRTAPDFRADAPASAAGGGPVTSRPCFVLEGSRIPSRPEQRKPCGCPRSRVGPSTRAP